jgi:hypothetical protein
MLVANLSAFWGFSFYSEIFLGKRVGWWGMKHTSLKKADSARNVLDLIFKKIICLPCPLLMLGLLSYNVYDCIYDFKNGKDKNARVFI